MKNSVSIIIPYYNTPDSLVSTLAAMDGALMPVVVVNNNTPLPELSKYRNVRVVSLPYNSGFAHACNVGAALCDTEWILFANCDLHLTPDHIRDLMDYADEHDLDAASPTLVDDTGKANPHYHQPIPSVMNLLWQFSPLSRFGRYPFRAATTLPGACLLMRRDVWKQLEGWDERFFLWWEDSDLSKRLARQDFRFAVVPHIHVAHQGGETFEKLPDQWRKDVFFHSLGQYAKKHLHAFAQQVISGLTYRFSKAQLYLQDDKLRISVVVPNLRSELMVSFLEQNINRFDFAKDELIVVTSATNLASLRKKYPQVVFIALEKNRGFASTVNTGFLRARGKYLSTVNDDVVLPPDWITQLLPLFTDNVGSVSPKVVKPTGEVESLGVTVLKHGKAVPNKEKVETVDTFNAAAVIFSRHALETCGMFDEAFGSYLEDVDLGLRMKRYGYQHVIGDKVEVIHLGQTTSKHFPVRKAWLDMKNWWLVVIKNWSFGDWIRFGLAIMIERGRNFSGYIKSVSYNKK